MAPPVMSVKSNGGKEFESKLTWYVFICGLMAANGGLMFGYDIGISGGVTQMDDFLERLFPTVYVKKHQAKENNYCKYDNQFLQLFTSSLYLAALISCFFASKVCTKFGRRLTIQAASIFFLIGSFLCAFAPHLWVLIIGRILLGIGVGFGNQAAPLLISEIAPVKYRGGLNICFQLMVTVGILIANLINYRTSSIHPWGWRLSLGLAAVPASILFLGSLIIVDTPTSLIERGKLEQGKKTLQRIRGTENVELEYNEIVQACEVASQIKHPFKNLMKRSSRPQLVITIMLQVFQQFSGINAIMFYAPVLFQTMGFKNDGSLLSAVITGLVNVLSTLVANFFVDKVGRRKLLLEACIQMIATQGSIGAILYTHLKSTNTLDHSLAVVVVVLVCLYVMGFAWSWGPLGWLIPSEIFPLEIRTAGFAFAVSSNMLFTFLIAQAFLSMLCHMRAGIFFFFVAWIVVMMFFTIYLLPETKRIPLDEINQEFWKRNWYWKRFMDSDNDAKA